MSISWSGEEETLTAGITTLNKIDVETFSCILKTISFDNANKNSHIDNQQYIKELLKLNDSESKTLYTALNLILNKLLKIILKPKDLQDELTENLRLHKNKADIFVKLWSNHVKDVLNKVQIGEHLERVAWELYSEIASDSESMLNTPKANIQLVLSNNDNNTNLNLELNQQQLSKFYNELEQIQFFLDNLNK